jgi:hypothetical protein
MLKKITTISMLTLTTTLVSSLAFSDSIQIGAITTAGTGCPNGTVASSVSPDNSAISLLFDAYTLRVAAVPANQGQRGQMAQADCQIMVPITLPPDTMILLNSLDYRGFASLPAQAEMNFTTRDGFKFDNNHHEDQQDRANKIQGVFQDVFTYSRNRPEKMWSKCGGIAYLTSKSRLQISSRNPSEEAIASIDSIDATLGVKFNLITKPCKQDNGGNGNNGGGGGGNDNGGGHKGNNNGNGDARQSGDNRNNQRN